MMKRWYILHSALHLLLYGLGFYFLQLDAELTAKFWEVGWQNYDGKDIDFPENTYYFAWMLACLWSLFLAQVQDKDTMLVRAWKGISVLFFIGYLLCYFSDGGVSMKESLVGWHFTTAVQILFPILLYNYEHLSNNISFTQKQLFGLNALLYLALLGLGFYCLQWFYKIEALIQEIRANGGSIYDNNGMYSSPDYDNDIPCNTYHLILTFATLFSIFLTLLSQQKTRPLNTYKGFLCVFFLYSIFVYINDGNPDMEETLFWWPTLCLLSFGLSAFIYWSTPNQIPKTNENDILDDLSNLH